MTGWEVYGAFWLIPVVSILAIPYRSEIAQAFHHHRPPRMLTPAQVAVLERDLLDTPISQWQEMAVNAMLSKQTPPLDSAAAAAIVAMRNLGAANIGVVHRGFTGPQGPQGATGYYGPIVDPAFTMVGSAAWAPSGWPRIVPSSPKPVRHRPGGMGPKISYIPQEQTRDPDIL